MQPAPGENGVWEAEVGIPPGRNTYYYFEVVLAEPVSFETLDRKEIADDGPNHYNLGRGP